MQVRGIALTALLSLVGLSLFASDEDANIQYSTLVPPKIMERWTPEYPVSALKKPREAWVLLYFVVNEDGIAANINVFDSVGAPAFEQAAIAALKRNKYVPATRDGKRIPFNRSQLYKFELEDYPNTASKSFVRVYRRLEKHVAEENKVSAERNLKELKQRAKSFYELSWSAFMEFTLHRKWGSRKEQLNALDDAILDETTARYLPENLSITALAHKIELEMQLQHYRSALSTYEIFAKSEGSKDIYEPTLTQYMQRVNEYRKLRSPFSMTDEFDRLGRWSYRLLWNRFTLRAAAELTADIAMCCENKNFIVPYKPDIEYEVPDSVGNCTLYAEGLPNTKITIHQL